MIVIDIDIHNSTTILEHIRQVLKGESFTGWTILINAQHPNRYWKTYPNHTARFFRFDLEKRTFSWQYEDDQAAMVDGAWNIDNFFETAELFQFITDNSHLFVKTEYDGDETLEWLMDAITSPEDAKAASEPIAYKKRLKPLKFVPAKSNTLMDFISLQPMMSNMEPGLVFPMDYVYGIKETNPCAEVPLLPPKKSTLTTAKIYNTMGLPELYEALKSLEGLHDSESEYLKSHIKKRITQLQEKHDAALGAIIPYYEKKISFLPKKDTEYHVAGKIADKLKEIAKTCNAPILISHQPPKKKLSDPGFKSPWLEDSTTFASFQMKQEFQKAHEEIYAEYIEKHMADMAKLYFAPPYSPKDK